MSDEHTIRLLEALDLAAPAPTFLASHFQAPESNYYNSEKIEMDVIREDETVARLVSDIRVDPNEIALEKYVNKGYESPVVKERFTINAFSTIKRQMGQNPFENPDFLANATGQAKRGLGVLMRRQKRLVELQAAQIFQGGVLSLANDATSGALYSCNYQAKNTHHATVSTTWALDGASGSPLSDLATLMALVRKNGKRRVNRVIFGASAWVRFIANPDVQQALARDRLALGNLAPKNVSEDAAFQGYINIGGFKIELFTYDGCYVDPTDGNLKPYVHDEKVILLATSARLDATFGGIPRFPNPENGAPFLNGRISNSAGMFDLNVFSYYSPNRVHLYCEVQARPLLVPTEIDSFASLDVTA